MVCSALTIGFMSNSTSVTWHTIFTTQNHVWMIHFSQPLSNAKDTIIIIEVQNWRYLHLCIMKILNLKDQGIGGA